MRQARVFVQGIFAGILSEQAKGKYHFSYDNAYQGLPVSLTMPIEKKEYQFNHFPTYFEGLLPEGIQLEALLRQCKLDKQDYFGQLLQVGNDLVGAVTVEALK